MDVNAILKNINPGNQYNNSGENEKEYQINSGMENLLTKKDDIEPYSDSSNKSIDNKDLTKSIEKLNKLLEKDETHAEYSVYKELGRSVIKIVDDKTNKVIMEFPEEKVLDTIASILKSSGLLDEKA